MRLEKDDLLGVRLLRYAYDDVIQQEQVHLSTLTPVQNSSMAQLTNIESKTELWQEYMYPRNYSPKWLAHVPPPNWGTFLACQFVVVTEFPSQTCYSPVLQSNW
jgi:hypothetical protein